MVGWLSFVVVGLAVFGYGLVLLRLVRMRGWREVSLDAPFIIAGNAMYASGKLPPALLHRLRHTMAGLHGEQNSVEETKRLLARMVRLVMISGVAAGAWSIAWLHDPWSGLVAWLLALLLPWTAYQDAERRWRRKRQVVQLELPVVLSKMLLLIEAGETMQRALVSSASSAERKDHPLYAELIRLQRRLDQRVAFIQALEEMSRRCPVKEMRLFVNALSLNYKRGGDQLTLTLRELSSRLWSERQATARTLGEEASSKLLFPMVILFLVVMAIVATPAMMLLG